MPNCEVKLLDENGKEVAPGKGGGNLDTRTERQSRILEKRESNVRDDAGRGLAED